MCSPDRLNPYDTRKALNNAFTHFEEYIEALTRGELDVYFDFNHNGSKPTLSGVRLPDRSFILLDRLGENLGEPVKDRIKKIFIFDTVHLFGVSGSGKTRLTLDGLCMHWGLYFFCAPNVIKTPGSLDFKEAKNLLIQSTTWRKGKTDVEIKHNNTETADRVFAMMLCARIFVLDQLIRRLPPNTTILEARRRWVLAQVLPPSLETIPGDLFVRLFRGLRLADTRVMLNIVTNTLASLANLRPEFFTQEPGLFVVIDEAQVAADSFKYFPNTTGETLRPILREMYRFFHERNSLICGIILAGTGLSIKMVRDAVGSLHASAKQLQGDIVITDVGRFMPSEPKQEKYIRRFLTLSDTNVSDQRLLERIKYWFSGRYRLTASLMELFLHSRDAPRHRVLTKFVERITGFTITDGADLEDNEPPISVELETKIESYGDLLPQDRLFEGKDTINLISWLVSFLRLWTVASDPRPIPIVHNMHDMIVLGVGFLDEAVTQEFYGRENFPVYISEPLIVLALSSTYKKQDLTTRLNRLQQSFFIAANPQTRGYVFEEAVMFLLMDKLGGDGTTLDQVFYFNTKLGSRKVRLVALKHHSEGHLSSFPVSWHSGCSDRFGTRAQTPQDVLDFLNNPDGKAFLFPDSHMGPDLICFLEDEKIKELIILAVQEKFMYQMQSHEWKLAFDSLIPQFYYTQVNEGERAQYAPLLYPNLTEDLKVIFDELVLEVHDMQTREGHHMRLQSQTAYHQLP